MKFLFPVIAGFLAINSFADCRLRLEVKALPGWTTRRDLVSIFGESAVEERGWRFLGGRRFYVLGDQVPDGVSDLFEDLATTMAEDGADGFRDFCARAYESPDLPFRQRHACLQQGAPSTEEIVDFNFELMTQFIPLHGSHSFRRALSGITSYPEQSGDIVWWSMRVSFLIDKNGLIIAYGDDMFERIARIRTRVEYRMRPMTLNIRIFRDRVEHSFSADEPMMGLEEKPFREATEWISESQFAVLDALEGRLNEGDFLKVSTIYRD